MSVWIGDRCLITGDVLHHSIQCGHPDWTARGARRRWCPRSSAPQVQAIHRAPVAGELAHAISLVEDDPATMPDQYHSTWQPICRNRIVDQLGNRSKSAVVAVSGTSVGVGAASGACVACALSLTSVCCIALRGSRSDRKQDSSYNYGLSRRWLTEHNSGPLVPQFGVPRRGCHVHRRQDRQQERENLVVGRPLAELDAAVCWRERSSFAE